MLVHFLNFFISDLFLLNWASLVPSGNSHTLMKSSNEVIFLKTQQLCHSMCICRFSFAKRIIPAPTLVRKIHGWSVQSSPSLELFFRSTAQFRRRLCIVKDGLTLLYLTLFRFSISNGLLTKIINPLKFLRAADQPTNDRCIRHIFSFVGKWLSCWSGKRNTIAHIISAFLICFCSGCLKLS